MSGTLAVSLLGAPRVQVDGQTLRVDTRMAVALLAHLAVTGRPHRREALAALLWPESDDASARATLRRTLSALRKGLGGDWLHTEGDLIALTAGPGFCLDVAEFRARLAATAAHGHAASESCPDCLATLQAAAALYEGDFLAGFTLRESPTFDDWQAFEADALRRELAAVLRGLVQALSARGALADALPHARRWLALDPLNEAAHRQLMLLHAWAGERGAALQQYRACVQVLQQQLGVAPLAETTQLAEAIKEHRAPPPPAVAPGPPSSDSVSVLPPAPTPTGASSSPHAAPLVGRGAGWDVLLRTHQSISRSDGGRLVVLEGEAGIGKTRLAEEFLAHAESLGAATATARCYEGEASLAYGPIAGALRGAFALPERAARVAALPDHWLAEAGRLLPEVTALRSRLTPDALDVPAAHARFLEGLAHVTATLLTIREEAGHLAGVLFIDDAQWADEASLDFLAYIARRLTAWPLLLLVTWRTESVAPEHRLRAVLAHARRAGWGTQLTLDRLGVDEVAEMLLALTADGRTGTRDAAEALYRQSEGVPFFVLEYLATGREGQPGRVPGGVRDLLRARLAAADDTGQQLLAAAAVIGRSFDPDVLREASGRSEDEVITGLERLLRLGLVRELAPGSGAELDFAHERLRDVVYDGTSLIRRRLLHRRVGDALKNRARGRADAGALAGQIARHYQAAGLDAEAALHYQTAGEHARSVFANAEALDHYGAALALGHPDPAALHEAIGDLQTLAGDYAAAQVSYEAAAGGRAPSARAGVEHKLGRLYLRRSEWELAEHHFREALDAAGAAGAGTEGHAGRARLLANWSFAAQRGGDAARAASLAVQALALAEGTGDALALAEAHNTLGLLARERGAVAEARHHLERSLSLATGAGDQTARVAALNNLALACRAGGDLDRARSLMEAALAASAAQGDRHREAALHNNLADLLHAGGERDAAMRHVKQAVAVLAEIGMEQGAPETLQPEIWKLTEW